LKSYKNYKQGPDTVYLELYRGLPNL